MRLPLRIPPVRDPHRVIGRMGDRLTSRAGASPPPRTFAPVPEAAPQSSDRAGHAVALVPDDGRDVELERTGASSFGDEAPNHKPRSLLDAKEGLPHV